MNKYHQDWSWKPDDIAISAEKSALQRKRDRRRRARKAKRKRKSKAQRDRWLCSAPGYIFYRTKRWLILRRRVIDEYGYRCMCCGAVDTEIHVDHIQPRSRAPHLSLKFDNLQVLCRECNMNKSNIHAEDYREKAAAEELDILLLAELMDKSYTS